MMRTEELKNCVPDGFFPVIFDEAGSTNDIAKSLAAEGAPEFTVVIAGRQTGGRGRRGRTFFSPEGSGLYLSIILRPDEAINDALLITTMTAAALSVAIENAFHIENGIKWVNDIYSDEKKVAGILTEGGFEGEKLSYAIVGVGINVSAPENGFPEEIKSVAGALLPYGSDERGRLLTEFLSVFAKYYKSKDKTDFIEEYRRRMFLEGRKVIVIRGDERREAVVSGLDERLGLMVCYSDGTREVLSSGEVSLVVNG